MFVGETEDFSLPSIDEPLELLLDVSTVVDVSGIMTNQRHHRFEDRIGLSESIPTFRLSHAVMTHVTTCVDGEKPLA